MPEVESESEVHRLCSHEAILSAASQECAYSKCNNNALTVVRIILKGEQQIVQEKQTVFRLPSRIQTHLFEERVWITGCNCSIGIEIVCSNNSGDSSSR